MNMKTKIIILCSIVLVAVLIVIACTQLVLPNRRDVDGINIFKSSAIKRAYHEESHESLYDKLRKTYIKKYYGEFTDCEVFQLSFSLDEGEVGDMHYSTNFLIDGIDIRELKGALIAYKDGKILDIRSAYKQGWLSYEDLEKLSELTNAD